ncbi:helix-turn-helix domain-containing protein [Streptomyces anandii]|uniref:helix-turn-helix domain-containing protein n=1 Tax=Streptomyces anandii TaxID=285454 RepID=UPI0037ADFF17
MRQPQGAEPGAGAGAGAGAESEPGTTTGPDAGPPPSPSASSPSSASSPAPAPASSPPPASSRPLVAALGELRDRTGLSLAALAARTPYSKSAWHRYLTGAKHPPRSAVEALARLAGADPAPALALWDTAAEPPLAPAGPPVKGGGRLPLLPALTLLTTIAAVAVAATVPTGSFRGAAPGDKAAATTASTSPGTRAAAPATPVAAARRCRPGSCQGGLPGASVCAGDARTESAVSEASYTVRLRWSPSCGTAWSQVRVRGAVAREVSVRTDQDTLSATYSAGDTRADTSPMLAVRSPRGVEACAEVNGEVACTGLGDGPDGEP